MALLLDDVAAAAACSQQPHKGSASRLVSTATWWEQWQRSSRDTCFYRIDLVSDLTVQLLTLLHHVSVWLLHGFSFQLLDALLLLDTRVVVVSVFRRLKGHRMHQELLLNLNSSFPDVDVCQLATDGESECVICRDRMTVAKQLPCGHFFHLQVRFHEL